MVVFTVYQLWYQVVAMIINTQESYSFSFTVHL